MGQFPSRRADGALLDDEIEGEGAVEGPEVESGRGQSGYHEGAAAARNGGGGNAAPLANNFGLGAAIWGAVPLSRARAQPPQRNDAADPNPFPALQPNVTLQSLIADGLRPDIALNPYQMPRLSDDWEPSAAAREARGEGEEKEGGAAAAMQDRPTIRCSNPMQLHKSTLMLEPLAPVANRRGSNAGDSGTASSAVSPTVAALPGAAAAAATPRPSHSSSYSRRYGLTFQFETRIPCSVHVHWLCNEVAAPAIEEPLDDRSSSNNQSSSVGTHDRFSRFVPNAGAASVAASSVAGSASEVPAVPLLIPAQHFAPGKHTFCLPANAALNTTNLSDLQLTFSNRLRYWPVVVQFDEQPHAAAAAASSSSGGESKEELERVVDSSPVLSAAASSSATPSSPRVRQLTAYCTLSRHALTGAVTLKLVKQAVRITPTNQRFEIQEIFGLKEEQQVEGGAAAVATAAAAGGGTIAALSPSSTGSSGTTHPSGTVSAAGECVVCLVESKTTLILPCRHMCLCADCAVSVKRQTPARCPVCRAPVEGTVRILDA